MTSKERAALRAQANTIETTLIVGKGGVSEQVLQDWKQPELLRNVDIMLPFMKNPIKSAVRFILQQYRRARVKF